MWAAPTAQSDFSILISFRKLNWKQKLIFLQQLNSSLAYHTNISQIQICFLGLLEEKNINVLAKVLKLIRNYIKLYSMSILSFREFTSNMLSFNSHLLATDDILVQFIQISVHSHQQIDQVLKGLEDIININPNVDAILKMMNFIITSSFNMHVLTNASFEKCIIYCFNPAHNANITDAQSSLLKNIVDLTGNNSILLGRKLKLSTIYINKIKFYVSLQIEQKRDCSNEIQINYIYELISQQWLQDYKIISMKFICLSLKQALLQDNYKNIQINFSFRLLESLSWLSHRKNKNINKYIYDIVGCSINRNAILTSQQLLLQILFQALGDKRISKRLKQQEITYKQQMWIGLANQTYVQAKIKQVNNQQEYHRLIILLGILKARNLMDIKALCEDLQQKQNLSNTYRIQLQQLSKT